MNLRKYQETFLHACIQESSLVKGLNDIDWVSEELSSIHKALVGLDLERGPVSPEALTNEILDSHHAMMTKDLIKHWSQDRLSSAGNTFRQTMGQYDRALQRKDATEKTTEALKLMSKGQLDAGVSKLREVSITTKRDEVDTQQGMLLALNETDGFRTGLAQLDSHTGGFNLGNLSTIYGDTGSMKTMVSLNLIIRILEQNPKFTAIYFEKEMPEKEIYSRLTARFVGIKTAEVIEARKKGSDALREYKKKIDEYFEKNPKMADLLKNRLKVYGPGAIRDVHSVCRILEHQRPQIWCIDYIKLLVDANDNDTTRSVNHVMRLLKDVCQDTNSLGIILSQINRSAKTRGYKMPTSHDCEYGSDIENFSAYMFSTFYPTRILRDDEIDPSWYYLVGTKMRHQEPITIKLIAKPEQCLFEEPNTFQQVAMAQWIDGYQQGAALHD